MLMYHVSYIMYHVVYFLINSAIVGLPGHRSALLVCTAGSRMFDRRRPIVHGIRMHRPIVAHGSYHSVHHTTRS